MKLHSCTGWFHGGHLGDVAFIYLYSLIEGTHARDEIAVVELN